MIENDRGDTREIAGIREVYADTCPYDRNGFVEAHIEQHGKAVLIADWWPK